MATFGRQRARRGAKMLDRSISGVGQVSGANESAVRRLAAPRQVIDWPTVP